MFKGKCGTEETVRRLAVLAVASENALEENHVSVEQRKAMRREIGLTLRGCRGTTAQRIADAHVAVYAGAVWN